MDVARGYRRPRQVAWFETIGSIIFELALPSTKEEKEDKAAMEASEAATETYHRNKFNAAVQARRTAAD
jgi:hypothetical protein